MRWVVTAEVIRDDGTSEIVELGSVHRGPSTAAHDVGLTLAEPKPRWRNYKRLSFRSSSGGTAKKRGSARPVGAAAR